MHGIIFGGATMSKGQRRKGSLSLGVLCLAALLWPAATGAQEDVNGLKAELQAQKQRQVELEDKINQLEARQKLKERALTEKIEQVAAAKPAAGAGPRAGKSCPDPEVERFRRYFQDGGLPFTEQRRRILEEVCRSASHFDAEELYGRIRRRRGGPDSWTEATVAFLDQKQNRVRRRGGLRRSLSLTPRNVCHDRG